jgi:hypothetical protein
MTDNEIIKALECCANNGDCKECAINPHKGNYGYCTSLAIKAALDLINHQKAEIERLKNNLFCKVVIDEETMRNITNEKVQEFELDIKSIKAEAIKEFAERLKTEAKLRNHTNYGANKQAVSYNEGVIETRKFMLVCIDTLVKEMVGDTE